MSDLTTGSKIQKFFEQTVISRIENWQKQLCDGGLHDFEAELSAQLSALRDQVCKVVLPAAAEQVYDELAACAKGDGCRKIVARSLQVRLSTGSHIEVCSPYVKEAAPGYEQKRHLLSEHWRLIGSASPALYDKVGFCAAICPSYDAGHELLMKFGVQLRPRALVQFAAKLFV